MSREGLSPVLISGMHRSGTSMVTSILSKCGLIIGRKLDANNESLFFQRINIWMMSLMGSSWDNPSSFKRLDSKIKEDIVSQLEGLINSRGNTLYFGWRSIIKKDSFYNITVPWGWKDPRNIFTQEIWKEVFPDMKTIEIIRHPIDTASSLMNRQKKEIALDINRKKTSTNVVKALLSISHTNYNSSMILNSYQDCFKLIESYYDQISIEQSQYRLVMRFEDILENPEVEVLSLLEHCELSVSKAKLDQILSSIDSNRKYAYRNNSELVDLENTCATLINKMGYLVEEK